MNLIPSEQRRSLFWPLLGGTIALLLALAFIKLAGEILEGDTHAFDTRVLHAMQGVRAQVPWISEVMRDLSGLGSTVVLGLVTVIAVGYLVLVSRPLIAALMAASVITGTGFVTLFKVEFARARPAPALAESVVSGLSFPSGHTSMSAIVFLTIGALVAGTRARAVERAYIIASAALLTVVVGMSRIALGVHWATDVLGGWALGAAWAVVWLLVTEWLQAPSSS